MKHNIEPEINPGDDWRTLDHNETCNEGDGYYDSVIQDWRSDSTLADLTAGDVIKKFSWIKAVRRRIQEQDMSEDNKPNTVPSMHDVVLRPHWPEGLEQGRFYQFNCDDDGRDGTAFFRVLVANDGDVHLCASKRIERNFLDPVSGLSHPSLYDNFPSVRCRTLIGGGRHSRTRQALLWLARAIQLDNEELGIDE